MLDINKLINYGRNGMNTNDLTFQETVHLRANELPRCGYLKCQELN